MQRAKTLTRGRFAPLAQVPPIAFLFSFSFLFTLNLNYEKILPYLYSTIPLASLPVRYPTFGFTRDLIPMSLRSILETPFRFFGINQ